MFLQDKQNFESKFNYKNQSLIFAKCSISTWTLIHIGNCNKWFKIKAILIVLRAQSIFQCKRLIHPYRLQPFPDRQKYSFLCLVLSYQFVFMFMECVFWERDSRVAQIAPPERPLREQCDKECEGGRKVDFCQSRSCKRAQNVKPGFLA